MRKRRRSDTSAAGIEFTERMAGYVSDKRGADYAEAAATGKAAGADFSFTVAVRIADIDAFIRDPAHAGTLSGTAICPALSPDPLDISNGIFRLMRRSDEQVETRLFEYLMTLTAREGRSYEFKGVKYVHDDRRADLVADTTTLFIDLAEDRRDRQCRARHPAHQAARFRPAGAHAQGRRRHFAHRTRQRRGEVRRAVRGRSSSTSMATSLRPSGASTLIASAKSAACAPPSRRSSAS